MASENAQQNMERNVETMPSLWLPVNVSTPGVSILKRKYVGILDLVIKIFSCGFQFRRYLATVGDN